MSHFSGSLCVESLGTVSWTLAMSGFCYFASAVYLRKTQTANSASPVAGSSSSPRSGLPSLAEACSLPHTCMVQRLPRSLGEVYIQIRGPLSLTRSSPGLLPHSLATLVDPDSVSWLFWSERCGLSVRVVNALTLIPTVACPQGKVSRSATCPMLFPCSKFWLPCKSSFFVHS